MILQYCRLPEWAKQIFFPGCELEKLSGFAFSVQTGTKLMARLKYGFLLREILERFTMKANSTLSPDRRLWVYSAHDLTISGLLNTMGLFKASIYVATEKGACSNFKNFQITAPQSKLCFIDIV